jgi:GNAT superfamily N-acetyltransferase
MQRRFTPPPGTRFPRDGDRAVDFEAAGPLRGKLSFAEILDYDDPQRGLFTLFRDEGGKLAGAACFRLREADVFVDYLTRNDRFVSRGVSVGAVLLRVVEDYARLHRREAVRLDAMQDSPLLDWYVRCGFVREGPARDEPGWGRLLPMLKPVSALAPP